MSMHPRHANADDALAILELVQAGFTAHIAADWELLSAQHAFIAKPRPTSSHQSSPRWRFDLVCEHGTQIVGVIFLPRPTLVQLFFVAPNQLRQGVGRTLWKAVRTHLE
jgi:GNAT superfamily N-acetyltransferase